MSKSKEKDRVTQEETEVKATPETVMSEPEPILAAEAPVKEEAAGESTPAADPAVAQRIYLGPSLPELQHGQVFIGPLPEALQALIKACPFIGKLLIPISKTPAARIDMNRPNSTYGLYASKILAFQAGRGKA